MISIFVVIGATAKLLNLRLKKKREALAMQQHMMGSNYRHNTCPDKVEAQQYSEA